MERARLVPVAFAAFVAVGVAGVAAGGGGPPSAMASQATQDVAVHLGKALYEERCATCHGSEARGTDQGPAITGLGPAVYDFQLSTGRMPLAIPGAQAVRKPPAFDRVEIEGLIAYLTSLGPGGIAIPDVEPEDGHLPTGQKLYQQDCGPCHGAAGNGGAVGDQVAPGLHAASPTEVAEAVRIGPGTMPLFGPETLPQRDLDSLVGYVLYLRDPEDVGGASLDHAGPIVEGFVALLVGLGIVVLVTRAIGSRS